MLQGLDGKQIPLDVAGAVSVEVAHFLVLRSVCDCDVWRRGADV